MWAVLHSRNSVEKPNSEENSETSCKVHPSLEPLHAQMATPTAKIKYRSHLTERNLAGASIPQQSPLYTTSSASGRRNKETRQDSTEDTIQALPPKFAFSKSNGTQQARRLDSEWDSAPGISQTSDQGTGVRAHGRNMINIHISIYQSDLE